MRRISILLYGLGSYLLFLGVFMYSIGFIGGFVTPTSLDGPLEGSLWKALAINAGLALLFAVQHSVMARPAFKNMVKQILPDAMERSTYVLAANLVMLLVFWQWRPMGGMIWTVENPVLLTLIWIGYGLGWATVFVSTCLIHHFDLFGVRQVWLHFQGKPYTHLPFATPGLYRFIRHPLYVGWLMVFWFSPQMGAAHLFFAVGMTAYILIAIQFEERDLVEMHPAYSEYRRQVPMLIPNFGGKQMQSMHQETKQIKETSHA